MIEITHQQAQRLIRESLDRPVDELQWSALQAHLEGCAECRAYRDRRLGLARGMARLMHDRWWTVMLDGRAFPLEMTARYARHTRRMRALRYALLALILFFGLAGGLLYGRANRPAPTAQPGAVAAVAATDTPTPPPLGVGQPGSFTGQVVFEAADPADPQNIEIYLLSPGPDGPELTNLTQHPAADYAPIWSPDGQWIAFLSTRDAPPGEAKAEIYVMSIAGTRLTRLTADANLNWQAPLTWSADGRYLAASAFSPVVPQGAIYALVLDDPGAFQSRPRPVPDSLGGFSPSIAPLSKKLAFTVRSTSSGLFQLYMYDHETGLTEPVHPTNPDDTLSEGLGMGLNWSAEGSALAYLAYGPYRADGQPQPDAGWQARVTYNAGEIDPLSPYRVKSSTILRPIPGRELAAAAFSPDGDLFYLVADAYGEDCPGLLHFPGTDSLAGTAPVSPGLPLLCIDTPIERASWTPDGEWLVAAGRERPGAPGGIYALHIPGKLSPARPVEVLRLADAPQGAGTPRVRPDRVLPASIDPRPAQPAAAGQAVPPGLLDRVLVSRSYDEENGWLRTFFALDGEGLDELPPARMGACPRRSPDGRSIAYVLSSAGFSGGLEALYVDGPAAGAPRQVSSFDELMPNAFWGSARVIGGFNACPEWSPDGDWLASYVRTDKQAYLAVFSTAPEGQPARFVGLDAYDLSIPPRWTSGSSRVAVVRSAREDEPARIVTIYPETGRVVDLAVSDGWNRVADMAYSPDGRRLAYLAQTLDRNGMVHTELRVASAAGQDGLISSILPAYPFSTLMSGYTHLAWLAGERPGQSERLGIALRNKGKEGLQSALMVFDLTEQRLRMLAVLGEDLQTAAWSPDGKWVIYSAPSGVWVLNVPAALAGQGAPIWLGIEAVDEINWR